MIAHRVAGDGVSCWTKTSLVEKLSDKIRQDSSKETSDNTFVKEQVRDLIAIFVSTNVLLPLPVDRTDTCQDNCVYFTYDNLPMFPPDLVGVSASPYLVTS